MEYPRIFGGNWKAFNVEPKWKQVSARSSSEDEAAESFIPEKNRSQTISANRRSKYLIPGLVFTNVVTLGISMLFMISYFQGSGINAALKAVSYYSPILDWIDIPMQTARLNGTIFPPEHLGLGRKDPSPEVNAEWEFFEKIRSHVITKEDIIKLGRDPAKVAKFEDEYWGLGDDAYIGQFDVFHQIHCLNLMRLAIFESYDGPSEVIHDYMYWTHLQHCIDMTLQNIKCHASTDMLTTVWMEVRPVPWVDFSINKKCKDFDKLLKFNQDHAVDQVKFDAMPKPDNAYIYPGPWIKHETELGDKLGPKLQKGKAMQPTPPNSGSGGNSTHGSLD